MPQLHQLPSSLLEIPSPGAHQVRITNRIAKFLGIFGAAKNERLGVTSVTPLMDGNEDGAAQLFSQFLMEFCTRIGQIFLGCQVTEASLDLLVRHVCSIIDDT